VMIGMPLTGWVMVSASRIGLPTLLYGRAPWPMIPGIPSLDPAAKAIWRRIGETGHSGLAWLLAALAALHVAGALKHQLYDAAEPVLGRMAPGARPGRRFEPRLAIIALAAAAVLGFGALVRPPHPSLAPAGLPRPQPAAEPTASSGPARPLVRASSAAPAPAPSVQPPDAQAAARPVRWSVSPGAELGFESAWGGQAVRGVFRRWRADIVFSPEALDRSHMTVVIDTSSADTGDVQRDAVLPTSDWFDATAHPQAVFRAERFRKLGHGRFLAQGVLELKGVRRPLDLAFHLSIAGRRAEAEGSAALDRTVFGVGQGDFAATDQIPARVGLVFRLSANAVP